MAKHSQVKLAMRRIGRDIAAQLEPHLQMMRVDLSVNLPVATIEQVELIEHRDYGRVEV
jgi:hypothetical protein